MKSDQEIKEFVDSRDALTRNELSNFIYGQWITGDKLNNWWQYTLKTKDWKKLRIYKEDKINNGNFGVENFNKYKEIHNKDNRIREAGSRKAQKILENVYSFHLARNIIISYKRKIQNV